MLCVIINMQKTEKIKRVVTIGKEGACNGKNIFYRGII